MPLPRLSPQSAAQDEIGLDQLGRRRPPVLLGEERSLRGREGAAVLLDRLRPAGSGGRGHELGGEAGDQIAGIAEEDRRRTSVAKLCDAVLDLPAPRSCRWPASSASASSAFFSLRCSRMRASWSRRMLASMSSATASSASAARRDVGKVELGALDRGQPRHARSRTSAAGGRSPPGASSRPWRAPSAAAGDPRRRAASGRANRRTSSASGVDAAGATDAP